MVGSRQSSAFISRANRHVHLCEQMLAVAAITENPKLLLKVVEHGKNAVDAAATPERTMARRMACASLCAAIVSGAAEAEARTLARSGITDILPVNAAAGIACKAQNAVHTGDPINGYGSSASIPSQHSFCCLGSLRSHLVRRS